MMPGSCQAGTVLLLDMATAVAKNCPSGKKLRKFHCNYGKSQILVFSKRFQPWHFTVFLIGSGQIPSMHVSDDVSNDGKQRMSYCSVVPTACFSVGPSSVRCLCLEGTALSLHLGAGVMEPHPTQLTGQTSQRSSDSS